MEYESWQNNRCLYVYPICSLVKCILPFHIMKYLTNTNSITRSDYCGLIIFIVILVAYNL